MPPKEPTRHQLSSRLTYNSQTPAFLLKLQNQVTGWHEEDEPQYFDGVDEFGRELRPPMPERPKEDERELEAEEEDGEEKPLVVVLKKGKHLDEEQAENERRKAKGLPPLPPKSHCSTKSSLVDSSSHAGSGSSRLLNTAGLTFSSTKAKDGKSSTAKRKVPDNSSEVKQNSKKKSKKDNPRLLSFNEAIG